MSEAEYDSIRRSLTTLTDSNAVGNLVPEDVLKRIGACSIRWGTNDY